MAIQGSLSIQSVQADITQIAVRSERTALAYQSGSKASGSLLLNTQESQIIDDVSISDAAVKQLEDTRALNNQLQRYLDYLRGEDNQTSVTIISKDNRPEAIAARATTVEASITAGKITETNIDIDFSLNDDGQLTELTVKASQTTTEFIRAEYSLNDTQFYASRR